MNDALALRLRTALVARLDDATADVRAAAGDALVGLPAAGSDTPDALHVAATTGSDAARIASLGAIARAAARRDETAESEVPKAAFLDAALANLSHEAAGVRIAALDAVAHAGSGAANAVEAILGRLAGDEDPDVRRAAVSALMHADPEAAFTTASDGLVASLGDEAVRELALAALAKRGWEPDSATGEAILAFAGRDFDALVRLGDAALPLLSRAVQDPDPGKDAVAFRARIIGVLEQQGTPAAIAAAEAGLNDVGGPARAAAARAVGRHHQHASAAAGPRLTEILTEDPTTHARVAAAVALGLMGYADALTELEGAAQGDPDAKVRFAASETIASLGNPRLLIEQLTHRDGGIRLSAATALGPMGNPDAIDPLIDALGDSLATVRAAALESLAQLGWTPVGVKRAPDDPRYSRWMSRAEQLARAGLKDADQAELLGRDLQADDALVRQAALEALSRRHDERLSALARPLLHDTVPQVRRAAAETLQVLGHVPTDGPDGAAWRVAMGRVTDAAMLGADALPVLLSTITSPAPNERADAAHALALLAATAGDAPARTLEELLAPDEAAEDPAEDPKAEDAEADGGDTAEAGEESEDAEAPDASEEATPTVRQAVVAALVDALADDEPYVRVNATLGLASLTELPAADRAQALGPLLGDAHATVRTAVGRALADADVDGLTRLTDGLSASFAGEREAAARALVLVGEKVPAPAFETDTDSEEPGEDSAQEADAEEAAEEADAGETDGASADEVGEPVDTEAEDAPAVDLSAAVSALSDRLADDDTVAVRVACADALGAIGGPHPALLDALRVDESYRVRATAARALGRTGWPAAADTLVSSLGDSYDAVRRAALAALDAVGWQPRSGVGEAMIRLADQDWSGLIRVGAPAIELLAQVVIERGGDPISVERRVRAIDTLLAIAEAASEDDSSAAKRAGDAIVPALGDEGGKARDAAARACGRLARTDRADRLLALAQQDPDKRTRVSATAALGRCGHAEQAEALMALAEHDAEPAVRLAARSALAGPAIGNLAPLIAALRSPVASVRQAAATQLGDIGDPDAIDPLIECLGDAVPAVRAACRDSLERLGWVPVGIKGDADEGGFRRWLTLAEVAALSEDGDAHGPVDQAALLLAALTNPAPEVRRAAIETLAMRGDASVAKAIAKRLHDEQPDVRAEAADALATLNAAPTEGVDAAAWCVARGEMLAAASLGPVALGPLQRAFDQQSESDRVAVVSALPAVLRPVAAEHAEAADSEEAPPAADQAPPAEEEAKDKTTEETTEELAAETEPAEVEAPEGFDETTALLLRALDDPSAAVREAATRAYGQVGGESVAEHLAARLDDRDLIVRRAAQVALAQLGDAGVATLTAGLSGSREARLAALGGLSSAEPDAAMIQSIGDVVQRDGDAGVRAAGIVALVSLRAPTVDAVPDDYCRTLLERCIQHDDAPLVRAAAASALAALGIPAADALVGALGDGYSAVRIAALDALDALGVTPGDAVGQATLALAAQDWSALEAVGEPAIPLIVQALADRGTDPDSQNKRAAAVACLAAIGGDSAARAIDTTLMDPSGRVRAAAADAAGRAQLPLGEALAALLETDSDAVVRARAALALGTIGAADQAKVLAVAASQDDEAAVRSAAALALAGPGIGDVERLISQLGDGDPEVRRAAAAALGPIGNPKAIDPLISALADSFASVRTAARASLDDLGWIPFGVRRTPQSKGYDRWILRQELNPAALDTPQLTVLCGALTHPDASIRYAVVEGLDLLDDPEAAKALAPVERDTDEAVARLAGRVRSRLKGTS